MPTYFVTGGWGNFIYMGRKREEYRWGEPYKRLLNRVQPGTFDFRMTGHDLLDYIQGNWSELISVITSFGIRSVSFTGVSFRLKGLSDGRRG